MVMQASPEKHFKKTRRLGASLCFMIPHLLIAVLSAIGLYETITQLSLKLSSTININVLLPIKVGLVGVLAAALLAFWGFFWTEVIDEATSVDDLPSIVRAYRRSFAYFVPALVLLFVSVGADFYTLLGNSSSETSIALSFGTLGASAFMILLFVLDFSARTLLDMNDLLKAGESP